MKPGLPGDVTICPLPRIFTMTLQQGTFVRLAGKDDSIYQVLSIDDDGDRCWVRRWPLSKQGSPPFAVPQQQLSEAVLEAV
jgi:hypothetical protein